MLKVIFALVLLCGACLAKEEHVCVTCATVLCKAPAICIEEEVECIRAPCCKVPVCIPLCGDDVCEPDEECVVDPCLIPPCPARCERQGCHEYEKKNCHYTEEDDGEEESTEAEEEEKREEDGAEVEEEEEEGEEGNRHPDDKDYDGCPEDPCAGVRCKSPLTCTPETVVVC
eukprot:Phypoly_transcript_12452.p1 GENE.Phypoly_transcript_12452~~Phypoly_transcript_12452.p1  ORF type:complete len:172 (+),score=41.63 Phypoly_transcript_12452:275-790(+)